MVDWGLEVGGGHKKHPSSHGDEAECRSSHGRTMRILAAAAAAQGANRHGAAVKRLNAVKQWPTGQRCNGEKRGSTNPNPSNSSPQKRRQSLKLTSSRTGIFCVALFLRQLCRYKSVDADTQKLELIKASNFDQCQKGCWLLAYGLHLCDRGAQGTSDRIHLGSLHLSSATHQLFREAGVNESIRAQQKDPCSRDRGADLSPSWSANQDPTAGGGVAANRRHGSGDAMETGRVPPNVPVRPAMPRSSQVRAANGSH